MTRPPVPVPGTFDGSTPCSPAIRATTGEMNALPLDGASVGAAASGAGSGATVVGSGAGSDGAASGSGRSGPGCTGGAGVEAAVSPPMRASTVPTSTVSPSVTRISVTSPDAGDGTSVSTLSVEISSSVSSASTRSPTSLSHLVIVPSETETPICGITTSTAVPVDMRLS